MLLPPPFSLLHYTLFSSSQSDDAFFKISHFLDMYKNINEKKITNTNLYLCGVICSAKTALVLEFSLSRLRTMKSFHFMYYILCLLGARRKFYWKGFRGICPEMQGKNCEGYIIGLREEKMWKGTSACDLCAHITL